jgi:pimeloyl-ACP methyl ester carboxylesterase
MGVNHWQNAATDGHLEGVPDVAYRPEARAAIRPGFELAYDEFGPEDGPVVLLIMGLGMQMLGWEEGFCAGLASRGYRVVRFDNRDVGASTRLSGQKVDAFDLMRAMALRKRGLKVPYILPDMAQDTAQFMDAVGIERAHVVGCSMGGMIAQLTAIHYPERVRTLTSIMSTTGSSKLPRPSLRLYRTLLKRTPSYELRGYQDRWLENWTALSGPAHPIDEQRLRARCARSFERGPSPGGFMRQAAAIVSSGSRRHLLGKITSPTLVIHGDADPLVRVEAGIDTADHIPGARLEILPGMGHSFPPTTWPLLHERMFALFESE